MIIRAVKDRELWEFADEDEERLVEYSQSFIKYKNRNKKKEVLK